MSPLVTNFAFNSKKECNFLYVSQFHVILFSESGHNKEEGGQNTRTYIARAKILSHGGHIMCAIQG